MAHTAILLIDLLGVQKMWERGGASEVKARINEFNGFVLKQIDYLPSELHRDGDYTLILYGDCLTVTCADFDQAIGIGTYMFTQAFYTSDEVSSPFWLRGAISPWHNQQVVMSTTNVSAKGIYVGARYVSEDDYVDVMALEKSGFKGMRLIVDRNLLPSHGASHTRTWSKFTKPLYIVSTLKQFGYPKESTSESFADVLWMADKEDRFTTLRNIMAKRFKLSAADPEEFVQAAWTRAVFDNVDSLVWYCSSSA